MGAESKPRRGLPRWLSRVIAASFRTVFSGGCARRFEVVRNALFVNGSFCVPGQKYHSIFFSWNVMGNGPLVVNGSLCESRTLWASAGISVIALNYCSALVSIDCFLRESIL